MLSKAEFKIIRSLHYKKYRRKHGLFIAEGPHLVETLINSGVQLNKLLATPEGYEQLASAIPEKFINWVDEETLASVSGLETHRGLLATVPLPDQSPDAFKLKDKWILCIDGVQDPGNLGTIIRTADWFGFHQLVCSEPTVDAFNPKVVQASMGSIFHVDVFYSELSVLFQEVRAPVYTLETNGSNLYETSLPDAGIVVVGHETSGVREELASWVTQALRIPGFGKAESLNAAVATAVTLSQLRAQLAGYQ